MALKMADLWLVSDRVRDVPVRGNSYAQSTP